MKTFDIIDFTGGAKKRTVSTEGDAIDIAREITRGKLYSTDTGGGRVFVRYWGTEEIAYIIRPTDAQMREEKRERIIEAVKRAIWACRSSFDGEVVEMTSDDIDNAAEIAAREIARAGR